MRALPLVAAGAAAHVHVRPQNPSARSRERFEFQPFAEVKMPHARYGDLTKSTYLSPPMKLKTGEAWFSLPDVTVMPMPAPGVTYAITAVEYDIVDETHRSIPLSEMYSHHWLVYDKLVGGHGDDVGCGGQDSWVSNVYGAGEEMRGIDYAYPDGYGYISEGGKQHWSANIHFIRTEDLDASYFNGSAGMALKSCVECWHVKGWMKGPECLPDLGGCGSLACCFDGTRCPVKNKADKTKKQYHLKYNVTWTTEVEKVKPIEVKVVDGFGCGICETVAPNKKKNSHTTCDDKVCKSIVEQKMPKSGTWLWSYTHQHFGAINSTLEVNGVTKCTSTPRRGTDKSNAIGNELGYSVGFDMCIDVPERGMPDAFHVSKGDKLRLTSYYNVDETSSVPVMIDGVEAAYPNGKHIGTMNLHYFYINPDDAPVPPAPAPPAETYKCVDSKCVAGPTGVPLATCQAAC